MAIIVKDKKGQIDFSETGIVDSSIRNFPETNIRLLQDIIMEGNWRTIQLTLEMYMGVTFSNEKWNRIKRELQNPTKNLGGLIKKLSVPDETFHIILSIANKGHKSLYIDIVTKGLAESP